MTRALLITIAAVRQPEHPLVRRMHAVEATQKRFAGKTFELGRCDCAKVASFHLRQLGWKVPKIERYRTSLQAARRLSQLGAKDMGDLLDQIGLLRISPAAALIGDLCLLPGDSPVGAICIALGNGAVRGFHEGQSGLVAMRTDDILAAWSVSRS